MDLRVFSCGFGSGGTGASYPSTRLILTKGLNGGGSICVCVLGGLGSNLGVGLCNPGCRSSDRGSGIGCLNSFPPSRMPGILGKGFNLV